MKTKLLLLLPLLALISCNTSEPTNTTSNTSGYKLLFDGGSPYLDWYTGNMEAFISYTFRDITNNTKDSQHERVRGTEDNIITLKNGVKIKIQDDYKLNNNGEQTELHLTRSATILQDETQQASSLPTDNAGSSTPRTFDYEIRTATPIEIIRPAIDNCNPLPYCYYDNFEIEWNADDTNMNGVVIIAEWNGVTLNSPSEDISIVCADLVDDTGIVTLNTGMFEGMPDLALVNLWFIRANLLTITENGSEVSLQDAMEYSPEEFAALLENHPELYIQLQPFMYGSGAVSVFSFFLVREL